MAIHDYDKILTRLTNILVKLHDGDSCSVKELALEFNVSDRTILRDLTQRLSSFPIYKDKTRWKMQDGYRLEKTKIFEEELVLDILEKMADNIGGKLATTSHKLLKRLKNNDLNPIYTKLNIEDISDKFDDIKKIEEAIKTKNTISCVYDNEIDTPEKEILKPLKIVNYEGFWYMVALDDNDYVRKCYLKKVSNIKTLDEIFQTDAKLDEMLENSISIWFQSDIEPYEVKIYASPIAAKYFKRKPLPTQSIESVNQDASIEFVVTITYEMEIIPIIKYWIPHLNIIEPLWIKELIDEDIKIFMKNSHNGV